MQLAAELPDGSPATLLKVKFTSLPPGFIVIPGPSLTFEVRGSMTLPISFRVDEEAPRDTRTSLAATWSAFDGRQSGTFTRDVHIDVAKQTWSTTLSSESVSARCEVRASSDGAWGFHCELHDSATIFGDNYAIGFSFDAPEHSGYVATGTLGSWFAGTQDGKFDVGGTDPWIAANWQRAFAAGMHFRLYRSDNPLPALFQAAIDALFITGLLLFGKERRWEGGGPDGWHEVPVDPNGDRDK